MIKEKEGIMNLFLAIVLFLIIAFVTAQLMLILEKKKLFKWAWVLFGFIVFLSFYLVSSSSFTDGLIAAFCNGGVIYWLYRLLKKKNPLASMLKLEK